MIGTTALPDLFGGHLYTWRKIPNSRFNGQLLVRYKRTDIDRNRVGPEGVHVDRTRKSYFTSVFTGSSHGGGGD